MISHKKFNPTKLKIFDNAITNHSMNKAYLLIGGNLGNRTENLNTAINHLNSKTGKVVKASEIYETAAWGKEDQPAFLNQALLLETILSPKDLMIEIMEIEQHMGRIRDIKYGPRIIDIDILLFNDQIIDDIDLSIPHPQLPYRKFALIPLSELDPTLIHPVTGKTIIEMNEKCIDRLAVNKKSNQSSE